MKALGLAAGLAAGYAQAKRQKTLDEERKADRELLREVRKAQLGRATGSKPSEPMMPIAGDEFGSAERMEPAGDYIEPQMAAQPAGVEVNPVTPPGRIEEYKRGGVVGYKDGGMVSHPNAASTSISWQKASYKK